FCLTDSLVKVRDLLVDIITLLSSPSEMFFFSLGKMMFYISDYDSLLTLGDQYHSIGLQLWVLRVKLEKGLNEEVIRTASAIKEKKEISRLFQIHALRSIANAYLNLGNYEQCKLHLQQIFAESITTQQIEYETRQMMNDVLLDAYQDKFFVNRYAEEKIKLENELNLALHISEELEERNKIALFTYLLALLQRDGGKFEDSFHLTNRAMKLLRETGYKVLYAAALGNLGSIKIILGELEEAKEVFIEILQIFSELEENRYIALTIKSLGDIAIAKGEITKAILEYERALKIIERLNLKEPYAYCVLAELYLTNNELSKFEYIIQSLDDELRTRDSPIIESYVLFLKGMKEAKELNFGVSAKSLNNALELADKHGRGVLSAKILMYLVLLNLRRYDIDSDNQELTSALDHLHHVLPYFIENKLILEQVALRMLEAKIYAILGNFTESFNSLHNAKELLLDKKNKKVLNIIEKRIIDIENKIVQNKIPPPEWIQEPFRNDIYKLEEIGISQIHRSYAEYETLPLAFIVLHRSGIPLLSYVIHKQAIKNKLLFGGFIVAIKDMLTELFKEQKSQLLVITYGNYKIIIETHPKGFSSVAISVKDSFSLRRKIHQITEKLSALDIPKQFYGELDEKLEIAIDEEVHNSFGSQLVSDSILKVDL
ncbi:MAG: tetratricopeptide repeat protein, partial [Candidatus Heimdallarchaeaceae archaeon]